MTTMQVVELFEGNQASLSLSTCDGIAHISCIRLTPEGELDHDVELFVKSFQDSSVAIKVYVELEAQLKMADTYGYKAKAQYLRTTVQQFI